MGIGGQLMWTAVSHEINKRTGKKTCFINNNKIIIEEQKKILAADRSNNYLDTNRLQELYPNVMNIKDSIENLMKKYNFN